MDKLINNLDLNTKGTWLPISVGIILILVILMMPKKLSWKEILTTFGIIGYVAWMIDIIFAFQLDLFDIGSSGNVGLGELILFGIVPSSLSVIYLNFFKEEKKWIYVTLFSVLSFVFEWGLVLVGKMELHGWRPWYSIPVYIIMYGFALPWLLKMLRNEVGTKGEDSSSKFSIRKIFIIKQKAK